MGDESSDTLPKLLIERARDDADRTAIREKGYGIWQSWTWREVAANVRDMALGLHDLGLRRDEIEHRLVDGSLDIAVMLVSNLRKEAGIESEVLMPPPRHLRPCAARHLMEKDAVSLAEVVHDPYVMPDVDEADRTATRYWEPTPYRPKVIFSTSSVEAVRSMVALGLGITILSNMAHRPWSLEGQHIELRPVIDHAPSMDVGLAWQRGITMSERTRVTHDYLGRTLRGSSHGFVNADVLAPGAIDQGSPP